MPALSRCAPCSGMDDEASSPSASTPNHAVQLLVRGVDGRVSHCVRLPFDASVADLQRAVHARTGVPAEDQVLTHGGRLLSPARGALASLQQARAPPTTTTTARADGDAEPSARDRNADATTATATTTTPPRLSSLFPASRVPRDACVHLSLRLLGGKGGFGAQLRAQGRDSRTDNFDACRDLSGRRLKHAEAEEALRRWEAEAPERELERAAKAHLAELARKQRREAREGEFDAQGAREEQERAVARAGEGVRGAVAEALARFGAAGADARGGKGKGGAVDEEEDEENEAGAGPSSGGTTATAAAGGSGSSGDEAAAAAAAAAPKPKPGGKRAAAGKNVEEGGAATAAAPKEQADEEEKQPKRAKPAPAAAAAAPPARARGMLALVEGSDDDDNSSSDDDA